MLLFDTLHSITPAMFEDSGTAQSKVYYEPHEAVWVENTTLHDIILNVLL